MNSARLVPAISAAFDWEISTCEYHNNAAVTRISFTNSVGDKRSAKYLRESLVDPQAAVPEGYLLVTVVTKDGRNVTGVRVNEDSFSLQIRDDSGRSYSFWKHEIAQANKQRAKSPMPSYKGQLSEDELTDLVAYLASLKEEK